MDAIKSPWLIGFGLVSVVHLILNATDATPYDSITKVFLAPLLAAWVIEQGGPRLLAIALAFCFFGDLFLELDDLFIVGMAAFAAGHVCFIKIFLDRGALSQMRAKPWIVLVYVVAAVVMVSFAWSGLDSGLKPVVPIYAALLVGTAATSLATDVRAGVGGALFLLSDGLILLGESGRLDNDSGALGFSIMLTYILAIFFLTTGIVFREKVTLAASADGTFDPTARTDCWPQLPPVKARG